MRPSKKILSPRKGEVWWSSNFVKVLEVKFLSKKSDTFGETIQKISMSLMGLGLWSSNLVKVLEVEFPSKKSDTFGETIRKSSKSQTGQGLVGIKLC